MHNRAPIHRHCEYASPGLLARRAPSVELGAYCNFRFPQPSLICIERLRSAFDAKRERKRKVSQYEIIVAYNYVKKRRIHRSLTGVKLQRKARIAEGHHAARVLAGFLSFPPSLLSTTREESTIRPSPHLTVIQRLEVAARCNNTIKPSAACRDASVQRLRGTREHSFNGVRSARRARPAPRPCSAVADGARVLRKLRNLLRESDSANS